MAHAAYRQRYPITQTTLPKLKNQKPLNNNDLVIITQQRKYNDFSLISGENSNPNSMREQAQTSQYTFKPLADRQSKDLSIHSAAQMRKTANSSLKEGAIINQVRSPPDIKLPTSSIQVLNPKNTDLNLIRQNNRTGSP